jgi:myo-inositol 2-dehydrogenase / D-chiro-inositol 1-dehydrogenase
MIGTGWIAETQHLPALRPLIESGEVVLQAFCDPNEDNLRARAAEYGVEACYTDHHPMLDQERLDAVYLLIPPTLHTDVELICAERGIHLLIEKPQTLDLAQACRFEAAIRKSGIVCQVGFMSRYYPSVERAMALLAQRTPRHANVLLFYSGAPVRYWTSKMALCGGSFVENTIHLVDLVRYFLGPAGGDIAGASAVYVPRREEEVAGPMDLPHAYMVNYRFENALAASFTTSRCLTGVDYQRREVLLTSAGSLIEWSPSRIIENGRLVWETETPGNAFALQAAAFVRAVREGDPSAVRSPYSEALNTLAAVLAANESAARGGEWMDVKRLTDGAYSAVTGT